MVLLVGVFVCVALFVLQTFHLRYVSLLWPVDILTIDYPAPSLQNEVFSLIDQIEPGNLDSNLRSFAAEYPNREFNSRQGELFALKVYDLLSEMGVAASIYPHAHWKQPSVIAKLPGQRESKVVIGCHLDSISLVPFTGSPGVDDNLSGVVTLLEAIRVLHQSSLDLVQTVEFHFYAAEEPGMKGSLEVLSNYSNVVAFLQQDMTGYIGTGTPHLGLVTDYASHSLSEYVKQLISTYCTVPYRETQCRRICSDHSAALLNGIPAVYVLESEVALSNPYIHSRKDTVDRLDISHMTEHVRLVVAFSTEIGMLQTLVSTKDQQFRFKLADLVILSATTDTLQFLTLCVILSGTIATLVLFLKSGSHKNTINYPIKISGVIGTKKYKYRGED
ncbi:hypothetical protein OGAPHI_001885 [Ogataea philodendri]|uniref:Peptide hydrolase n=1 Tax=Ogataea philodendri TaxID=1378263 RepID=A0A9P8T6S7_9ASCO|nr:uncharacterized protein OGAPHI_001885 [Ogataea philodendri]KAH3668131.1 hypothetical protein OGAPHI_001885 [Ogataea philodendri]